MHPVMHSDNISRVKSAQKLYQESDTSRKLKEYSLSQYLVYTTHCGNRSDLVYIYMSMFLSKFLWYIGIFTVFLRYVGLPVQNFVLDTNTGRTKIPSFQFYVSISPSSIKNLNFPCDFDVRLELQQLQTSSLYVDFIVSLFYCKGPWVIIGEIGFLLQLLKQMRAWFFEITLMRKFMRARVCVSTPVTHIQCLLVANPGQQYLLAELTASLGFVC